MKMDRDLQRRILTSLREHYPSEVQDEEVPGSDDPNYQPTLVYLLEHKLIEGAEVGGRGPHRRIMRPKITVKGIDFLEEDGGVTGKLNTVTVRFDVDEIRQLFVDKTS